MPLIPPSPFLFRVKGSYFGECERDDEGHCLPSGQAGSSGEEEKKPKKKPASKPQAAPKKPRGRVMESHEDADEWSGPFREWESKLSEEESGALFHYAETDSVQINAILRNKKPDLQNIPKDAVRTTDEIREAVRAIDRAITSATVPEDVTAYRVFNNDLLKDYKKMVGFGFVDSGFVSTSILREDLEHIPRGDDAMIAEIHVPKGSHAAYLGRMNELEEHELLLPRRSFFKITGYRKEGGKVVLEMELDPNWDDPLKDKPQGRGNLW